jgi:hypothetical protein
MVDQERDMYQKISAANDSVLYKNYRANHNVLDTSEPYREVGQSAYTNILQFIRNVVDKKPLK